MFMVSAMAETVRTTLVLEKPVFEKLRQVGKRRMSATANRLLAKELFGKRKSMFGVLKGKISVKDIKEDAEHDDLYS